MNSKAWIILIVFFLWCGGSWAWYSCKIKGYCYSTSNDLPLQTDTEPVEDPGQAGSEVTKKDFGPLSFELNSPGVFTSDRWSELLGGILTDTASGKVLTISCPYTHEETNGSSFENVGIARAQAVKALMAEYMDTSDVQVGSHIIDGADVEGLQRFEGAQFQWLTNSKTVKELKNGALIYFPYKSDEKIEDPGITAYLDELVRTLKENNQTVEIIGHTDDKGSAGYNEKLGQERADAIKDLLVSKGLDAKRIKADSKGESDPLMPNTTEENKAKNRRTEIKIQ